MSRLTEPTPSTPAPPTSSQRFLIDCRYVATILGHSDERAASLARMSGSFEGDAKKALVYRDERIEIVADPHSPSLAIELLKEGERYNPIVMVMADGDVIRMHGEHLELIEHVAELMQRAAATRSTPTYG